MATNIWHAKWKQVVEENNEEEDEELEALSFCDLPVNSSIEQEDLPRKPPASKSETREAEFDFCSWGGPEMCAADEVFFQGQMLPLCLSSKSTTSQRYGQKYNNWLFESRSESMDHFSSSEFHSNSSRSSSLRSQNSCSSASSTTTTTTRRTLNAARREEVRSHQCYTNHPSPKPQLKSTVTRQGSFGNNNHGRKSSSAWDIFRLGVVPAPEIGLQDIKLRSINNVNNKNYGNFNFNFNFNNSVEMSDNIIGHHSGKSKNILKQFVNKGSGLFSSCKCSSIETVGADIVMISGHTERSNETESTAHAMKEKVVESKRQKNRVKQGKKGVPRHHQSFEWVKGLLNNSKYHDEEALLSISSSS